MGFLSRIFKKRNVEQIIPNYPLLIAKCVVDEDKLEDCQRVIFKFWKPNKARYERVSALTGVPAWVVFCIHYKEASCDFSGVMHNGDKVIGNGLKTYRVPKGRGPFKDWEEAAMDALLMDKKNFPLDWKNISSALEFCEKYNGLGHRLHGELSPYIWAYTNNSDETGNFVSDGHYDSNAVIKSCGIAALLLTLKFMTQINLTADNLFEVK
jgi:lysozyme family protein